MTIQTSRWHGVADSDRTVSITLEWTYNSDRGTRGYLVKYLDRTNWYHLRNYDYPAPSFELHTYEAYSEFRDELLVMSKADNYLVDGIDVQTTQFWTQDGYPAFARFYPGDSMWTIHLFSPES